jgi:hypothetical protein
MPSSASWLQPWHDFFLLIGGASATLMGLVFVSASVAASIPNEKLAAPETRRLWSAPVIAAFLRVLVFGALGLVPGQSLLSFGGIVAALSLFDCARWSRVFFGLRHHQATVGDLEASDWWWLFVGPGAASIAMVVFGARLAFGHPAAIYGLGVAVVFHLTFGIHNAWESAEYLANLV